MFKTLLKQKCKFRRVKFECEISQFCLQSGMLPEMIPNMRKLYVLEIDLRNV